MISVYIASGFEFVDKVRKIAKELEKENFIIPVKWWNYGDAKKDFFDDRFYNANTKKIFERDLMGIKNSEVFLFVASDEPRRYTGANIELGIALGDNKRCYAVGKLLNSAMYYPVIKCNSIEDFIKKVKAYRKEIE